jgi:DNA-directed RNA polymerase subunit RPC12/RpoP
MRTTIETKGKKKMACEYCPDCLPGGTNKKPIKNSRKKPIEIRCPDCGEYGEIKGHQTCQYPKD